MSPSARWLGSRLHLQHGPIDLLIEAEGSSGRAYAAAEARFQTVLIELMAEIALLRRHAGPAPRGEIARLMHAAVAPFSEAVFVTPMAAVAGSVAQTILSAMVASEPGLRRAFVNNGGDIALHLGPGAETRTAIMDHAGTELGRIHLTGAGPVRGIATSGRHGRSLSLGIADSVTVLAASASVADVAATLIANAVDLPGHPSIARRPASDITDDSDLGDRPVVTSVARLSTQDRRAALSAGIARARGYLAAGHIHGAALHLQGETRTLGQPLLSQDQRTLTHA